MELHKGRSGASGPDREGSTPTWGAGGPRSGGGGERREVQSPAVGPLPPPRLTAQWGGHRRGDRRGHCA